MAENEFDYLRLEIQYDDTIADFGVHIVNTLRKACGDFETIYSYNVKCTDDLYNVHVSISRNPRHNTIEVETFIAMVRDAIMNSIETSSKKRYISYGQPPLELYLELHKNLIDSLAGDMHSRWPSLEFDDLKQMCCIAIMKLYRKGYYLHKTSIRKSFENEVYKSLKNDRSIKATISIDDIVRSAQNDDQDMKVSDFIVDRDVHILEDLIDAEDIELFKNLVIDTYGVRFYEQALFEYTNGETTAYTRARIQHVRNKYNWRD